MQARKFVNFSKEDFTWKYDGVPYTFKPNEPIFLEDYKAEHFAKHLVDREMNRANVEKGTHGTKNELSTGSKVERAKLEKLCFPSDEEIPAHVAIDVNEKAKRKVKKEPEFEDLKKV